MSQVRNGSIYRIMCAIYRLVAASGGDLSELTIDDVSHEHPTSIAQLHDKFFVVLQSTQNLISKLQKSLSASHTD